MALADRVDFSGVAMYCGSGLLDLGPGTKFESSAYIGAQVRPRVIVGADAGAWSLRCWNWGRRSSRAVDPGHSNSEERILAAIGKAANRLVPSATPRAGLPAGFETFLNWHIVAGVCRHLHGQTRLLQVFSNFAISSHSSWDQCDIPEQWLPL
jgi:hypothetical protein